MSDRPAPSRLRDVLEQLFGGPREEASHPLIDQAMQEAEQAVAGWTFGDTLRRLLGDMQHDVLTRPGAWAPLEAIVRAGGALGGEATFRLGGVVVATASIDARGEARALIRAPGPGTWRVEVAFGPAPAGDAVLQVVDGPVALVDGALALRDASGFAHLVGRVREVGFEVACFDVSRRERRALIRGQIARLGLPPMAVLTWDADGAHIEQLGFDLRRAFAAIAVRRHRAAGVPIALIVTDRRELDADALDGIAVVGSAEAHHLTGTGGLAAARVHAQAFLTRYGSTDPLRWRLDHMAGAAATSGNIASISLDNRRARDRVFELIDAARSHIHLQFYLVRPGAFTSALVARLVERARAGVAVRFMADALFSDPRAYADGLAAEPNVAVLTLAPIQTPADVDIPHLKQRDHRKLLIVDDSVAIVSGRNAGDEYYVGFDEVLIDDQTRHEQIPWLDAHVELTGPLVAQVQRCFAETWARHGGVAFEWAEKPVVSGACDGISARLVVHEGLVDLNGMATYEALFDAAQHHIYIVNDFPIVSILERAILRALARGVRVVVLTGSATARRDDGSFFPAPLHRTLFEHLVKARLEPLMAAGASVYEFATRPAPRVIARGGRVRPYVHAKIVSVDGLACTVGSANLDAAASFWESEAIVVIEDAATATSLEAELTALIEGSHPLDLTSESWQRERLERAVVARLWPDWFYS